MDKGEVGELGALRLALGSFDPVREEIYADAELARMRGGEGVQIVSVAAADLQREGAAFGQRQAREELPAQGGEALIADVDVEIEWHERGTGRAVTHAKPEAKVNARDFEGRRPCLS